MINNFEQIGDLINRKSNDPNDFWFVQVIKRRKDNPNLPRDMKLIDNYFIKGKVDLDEKKDKIIEQCENNNARAYIRLNKRNYKKVSCETLRLIAEGIANEDYRVVKNAFLSACGKFHSDENKKWLIDLDTKDRNEMQVIFDLLAKCNPNEDKVLSIISTLNGFHLITIPFDRMVFSQLLRFNAIKEIDIHKDNPTLLYYKNI